MCLFFRTVNRLFCLHCEWLAFVHCATNSMSGKNELFFLVFRFLLACWQFFFLLFFSFVTTNIYIWNEKCTYWYSFNCFLFVFFTSVFIISIPIALTFSFFYVFVLLLRCCCFCYFTLFLLIFFGWFDDNVMLISHYCNNDDGVTSFECFFFCVWLAFV